MVRLPLSLESAVSRSQPMSLKRAVNLYAEQAPRDAKTPALLLGTPGLLPFASAAAGPILEMHTSAGGTVYVVSGAEIYSLTAAGVATMIGTVPIDDQPVYMASSDTQVAIASGGQGSIITTDPGNVVLITHVEFQEPVSSVTYLNGYFVWTKRDSQSFFISAVLDARVYDALDFASAEASPDPLVRAIADHGELVLFGTKSIEPWYVSGDSDFPFRRRAAVVERGCLAPASVAKLDNALFWLGDDGVVYRGGGVGVPQRISTHEIERAIAESGYALRARGWPSFLDGHAFYLLRLPNANTLGYDVATQLWHERSTYERPAWRVGSGTRAFGYDLVGDAETGAIYRLDPETYTDGAQPLVSKQVCAPLYADGKRMFFHRLEAEVEVGVGLTTGQGDDPQAMMRWSDDGKTWSFEHWASIGRIGRYKDRAVWHRLGHGRGGRTFEVSISDPVKRAMHGMTYDASRGAS